MRILLSSAVVLACVYLSLRALTLLPEVPFVAPNPFEVVR